MRCQGATVPGTAGVMRGLEALADTWWGRLRSSGGGGGVGVGDDGAKQHAGGVHALSGSPAVGLSLHGFFP